jgi:hypothetical protein
MKIGSVVKLLPAYREDAEKYGSWLWVYEGKEGATYNFRAVATGETGMSRIPERTFENWGEEDDPS